MGHELLIFTLMLVGKLLKSIDNHAGIGAIEYIDRRRPHPSLKIVDGERDVLGIAPIEDPYFSVGCRFWHTVSIVME